MADLQQSVGGELTLGTEHPKPDVIEGWNFKVQGADDGGAQSLELAGLVPFVQLIGLYNEVEINRLLGIKSDLSFADQLKTQRTAVFKNEGLPWEEYNKIDPASQENVRNFEDEIKKNYIRVILNNNNGQQGNNLTQDGIILATNSPQAGNEAYEADNDATPKDAGGVGITDLQMEQGTKEFLNRRYKLRMTITDPQVLNDKPEYMKLATLQSMFLIIHGWSNPDQLTAWPEKFSPAPIVTDIGATIDGIYYPNGRIVVDMSHNNTGGAWGAALVATTMYDFAFNEVGQLEANFTFMPREITFMHTMRMPIVAPTIRRILGSGEQNEPFNENAPDPAPKSFAGYNLSVGNVIGEFGKNLAQIIKEEQDAYIGAKSGNPLSTIFKDISDEIDFSFTDKLSEWSETIALDEDDRHAERDYFENLRREQEYARFPHAGVGIGTYTTSTETTLTYGDDGEEVTTKYQHHSSRLSYYYLGWILEAMRFSLWDLNKGKSRRGEDPFDLKFRYMKVPRNSALNYAVQDQLSPSTIPSLDNYVANAMKYFQLYCRPTSGDFANGYSLIGASTSTENQYQIFRPIIVGDLVRYLGLLGYQLMEPEERATLPRVLELWKTLTREEKLAYIPNGDYRKSLVIDPNIRLDGYASAPPSGGFAGPRDDLAVRIMHPDFENQLLYNVLPDFGNRGWVQFRGRIRGNRHKSISMTRRRLEPNGVNIRGTAGEAVISDELIRIIKRSHLNGNASDAENGGRVQYTQSGGTVKSRKWEAAPIFRGLDAEPTHDGGILSLGHGFWSRTRGGATTFFGEGVFSYIDMKDGNRTEGKDWDSMIGVSKWWKEHPDRTNLNGDGQRDRSNPTSQANKYSYGLIMPALGARIIKGGNWKTLQSEYHNRHQDHLVKEFKGIVRNRIHEALSNNLDLEDIAEEPVDLFRLTGRIYNHGLAPYTAEELHEKSPNIIYTNNKIEIDRVQLIIDDLNLQLAAINKLIDNQEDDTGIDTPARDLLENNIEQFLAQPDNRSMFDALSSSEDLMVEEILDAGAKIGFWNSQTKLILKELISSDLIKMEGQFLIVSPDTELAPPVPTRREERAAFFADRVAAGGSGEHLTEEELDQMFAEEEAAAAAAVQNSMSVDEASKVDAIDASDATHTENIDYTYSSAFVAPPSIRKLPSMVQLDPVRPWISGRGYEWGYPQLLPNDVFGGIAYCEYYQTIIVNPNRIFENGEVFSSSNVGGDNTDDLTGAERSRLGPLITYGKEFDQFGPLIGPDTNYIMPHNWAELKKEGAARYIQWGFNTSFGGIRNYNVGLPPGDRPTTNINGSREYSPHVAIDSIGAFAGDGHLIENIKSKSLTERQIRVRTEMAKNLQSKFRNAYIFMNWVPQSMRDKYALPEEMIMDVAGSQDEQIWNQANYQYDQYINNCRTLLKKYVDKKEPLLLRIAQLEEEKSLIVEQIAVNQSKIESFQQAIDEMGGAETVSPFGDNTKFDRKITMPLGGGREMHLNGAKAQHWAMRFSKKLVYGASDIQNYGPPPGGAPYYNPSAAAYGWQNLSRTEYAKALAETPANLSYSQLPVQIAYLLDSSGNPREDVTGDESLGPENNINGVAKRGRTVGQFIEAKQVNELMLNNMFERVYNRDIAISNRDIYTKLIIDQPWPTYTQYGEVKWALYIDDDLDLIIPTYIRDDGTASSAWKKIPWRFLAEGTPVMIYPRTNGARIAQNEHFPNLPEKIVRSFVRTERNGYGGDLAIAHQVNRPFSNNGENQHFMMPSASLAGNPTQAYLENDSAKLGQSMLAVAETFLSAGRGPVTPEWPFGVPPDVEWIPSPFNGDGPDIGSLAPKDTHGGYQSRPWSAIPGILATLPPEFEGGFWNSVAGAGVDFDGGEPLNSGVKDWIINYLINELPQGRKIGHVGWSATEITSETETNWSWTGRSRTTTYGTEEIKQRPGGVDNYPIRDVVYGDLFDEFTNTPSLSQDFGNKKVESVAEIPIKRDVVDNLLSRKNANMSLMQFVQQLITPSAIGAAGNVQIAGRNRNGVMELAVASVDYRGIAFDMIKDSEALTRDRRNQLPRTHLLFDYKKRNSLIESVDMSSKMDPAAFLTYQNSASMIHGPGRDYNVLKLLEYEGVAEEFQDYLEGVAETTNAGESYTGVVHVGIDNRVVVDRARYTALPTTILDGFVAQNPERWAKITAMTQNQNNFTTDLLAFYMRSATLTIHGLTNIEPFNLINIKGVLPSLEGVYIITNITDRVTPGGFQTIIEAKLLRKKIKMNKMGLAGIETAGR